MGGRASDKRHVQHARQFEIGDELPLAGQQPAILAPQQRAADLRRAALAHSTTTDLTSHRRGRTSFENSVMFFQASMPSPYPSRAAVYSTAAH